MNFDREIVRGNPLSNMLHFLFFFNDLFFFVARVVFCVSFLDGREEGESPCDGVETSSTS